MTTTTIYSPEGPVGTVTRSLSPAPDVLAGLRLGILDNRKPNARLLLTQLAERLAQRTGARVALVMEKANAAVRCEPEVLDRLSKETDVILTGSAD